MFLNILRISASNVLKIFLIIISIGCTFVIFHLKKLIGSYKRFVGRQERNNGIK